MTDRLPASSHIKPIQYYLRIFPQISENKFYARCMISIEILNETTNSNSIILNGSDLHISNIKLFGWNENKLVEKKYLNTSYNKQLEQIRFDFESLPDKFGLLVIKYHGLITTNLTGFYRSTGGTRTDDQVILSTHFEPRYARKCFPCFDEPEFKARFKLEIVAGANQTVLTNTDLEEIRSIDAKTNLHIFEPTPLMSTYLVAFYIGDPTTYIEAYTSDYIRVRVHMNKFSDGDGQLALETVTKCMNFMTDYFDYSYPINKLDLISVPEFGGGAMENWGLIIFKERFLIRNPTMSASDHLEIMYVVCHEVAHQWFGNLVTMKWWTYLWLKESFATWMGWLAVEHIDPARFKLSEQIFKRNILSALEDDSIQNSHPIEINEITHQSGIDELFDTISYDKGAAIITMLANYIGHDTFKHGLQIYIKTHAYKNTTTSDLWDCLEQARIKDDSPHISEIMHNWIHKQNYPLIKIKYHTETHLKIQQEVFGFQLTNHTIWYVPLISNCLVLDKSKCIIPKTDIHSKINSNASGFYRVYYDTHIMNYLIENRLDQMSCLDTASMISDLYHFLRIGKIKFDYYLDVTNKILDRLDSISNVLWKVIYSNYDDFRVRIRNDILLFKYNQMLKPYIETGSDFLVFGLGCKMNFEPCISKAVDLFNKFKYAMMKHHQLKTDFMEMIDMIFKIGIQLDWDFVLGILYSDVDSDKQFHGSIINCLGLVNDSAKYIFSLDLFKTPKIKLQDKSKLFAVAGKNRFQNYLLWPYIRDNWKSISEIFPPQHLRHVIGSMQYIIGTPQLVLEIKNFFGNGITDINKFRLTLARTIEFIQLNHRFNSSMCK